MNTTHTLMSLCGDFDKIEIPIIQRDYAQGREEQVSLRSNFVNYLIKSLTKKTPIELDFIYGNIRLDQDAKNSNKTIRTFIPIDGQQRLTTLWLLHWFLAVKENRLSEINSWMKKFSYETRPSSHDFCLRLMTERFSEDNLGCIDEFVRDQSWFDNEWNHDGTVSGMLRMLKTFSQYDALLNGSVTLDQLLLQKAISFYFVPLKQFGLSEELYIRMNARGKILTDFENFKSEFYKIIKNNSRLEEVKDKMESVWVENLWPYRKKNVFVTDDCFMSYLAVITRMVYFRKAKYRADEYPSDFLDLSLLREIYSDPDNVDFLLFSLDSIPIIKSIKTNNLLWENGGTSLNDILANAIQGKNMITEKMIILFACLVFLYRHNNTKKMADFIRVVRNLIYNTNDKSERDQPRIMRSIEKLAESSDVHYVFAESNYNLKGLRDSQCREEHFKSLLILKCPESKALLNKMEDNDNLRGYISSLIAGVIVSEEKEIASFDFADYHSEEFNLNRLGRLYDVYCLLSKNGFERVWGDLLNTSLYAHNKASGRVVFDEDYSINPAIIALTVAYMDSGMEDIEEYLIKTEKKTIKKLTRKYEDFGSIRDVKLQLYLYYVLTRRIMMLGINDFFKNGWRFGWLQKEKGFASLFYGGIDGDPWFSDDGHNPIFQTYGSQFRYNWGLNKAHAIPIEIIGSGRPQRAFERLIEWAEEE